MSVDRIDLSEPTGLRLHAAGTVEVQSPPRMGQEQDGWMVSNFHVASDEDVHGDHWEIHPSGQEVVTVLSGHARLVLRAATCHEADETVDLPAGTACVVPQQRWHRLEIDGPTHLQATTFRLGTRLEPRA